jgi:hypothetical protein
VSTRTRIEWFTGIKLGYETADELGIGEFTTGTQQLEQYKYEAKRRQRRREAWLQLFRLYHKTKNPELGRKLSAHYGAVAQNKYWRKHGYPNLRAAWAANRRKYARLREEKALLEKQAAQRKELERYGL